MSSPMGIENEDGWEAIRTANSNGLVLAQNTAKPGSLRLARLEGGTLGWVESDGPGDWIWVTLDGETSVTAEERGEVALDVYTTVTAAVRALIVFAKETGRL